MDHAPEPPRPTGPPALVGLIAVLAAVGGVLLASGIGAVSAIAAVAMRQQQQTLEAEIGVRRLDAERDAAAEEVLQQVGLRAREVRLSRGAYPHGLGEALPEDPWGTPVRYERITSDQAVIRSAGPDGEFETLDDREHLLD